MSVPVRSRRLRPDEELGLPFTHFGIRKLACYLQGRYGRHDRQQVPPRQNALTAVNTLRPSKRAEVVVTVWPPPVRAMRVLIMTRCFHPWRHPGEV